jgi:uncharacterized membrane protein YccC
MSPLMRRVIFSSTTFAAAMLALWVAFSIGLPRPYWAMTSVYITVQPRIGALRAKGLYRIGGTLLGAAVAVAILPNLVNSPLLMSFVMCVWTGLCVYLAMLVRSPRAYVFLVAGYTSAIIGFPAVATPGDIFDIALARVEEIGIGIVCASVLHMLILPSDVSQEVEARISGIMRDIQRWTENALRGAPPSTDPGWRVAIDITELQLAATHLPFDTAAVALPQGLVRALTARLDDALPLIAGLEDQLRTVGLPAESAARLMADTAAWVSGSASGGDPEGAAAVLLARCRACRAALETAPVDWHVLLTIAAVIRLEQLIACLRDCRALADAASRRRVAPGSYVASLVHAAPRRRMHRDHGMALLSAVSVAAASFLVCVLWILTGWPAGASAVVGAAIFSALCAHLDDPAPLMATFLFWTAIALPPVLVYHFAILPAVDGFTMLALALAPLMVGVHAAMIRPAWAAQAFAFVLGCVLLLNLTETYQSDLPGIVNAGLAQDAGILIALGTTMAFRRLTVDLAASRILTHCRRALAGLAQRPNAWSRGDWASTMLDRVGLVHARRKPAETAAAPWTPDAVPALLAGLDLIDLYRSGRALDRGRQAVEDTLAALAIAVSAAPGRMTGASEDHLLHAIDAAIGEVNQAAPGEPRLHALTALSGLRRALCAEAPPFRADAADMRRVEGAAA